MLDETLSKYDQHRRRYTLIGHSTVEGEQLQQRQQTSNLILKLMVHATCSWGVAESEASENLQINIISPKLHSCPRHDPSSFTAVLAIVLFPSSKTLSLYGANMASISGSKLLKQHYTDTST